MRFSFFSIFFLPLEYSTEISEFTFNELRYKALTEYESSPFLHNSVSLRVLNDDPYAEIYKVSRRLLLPCPFSPIKKTSDANKSKLELLRFLKFFSVIERNGN